MTTTFTATAPAGADARDVQAVTYATLTPRPDGYGLRSDGVVTVLYNGTTPTPQNISAWQSAVANVTPDVNAPWRLREAKEATLAASVATLRQWASDARGTTVTSGNAVATLQTIVNRLGTFFDRFADLLEVDGRS